MSDLVEFLTARLDEDEANIDGDWSSGDGGLHIISTPMHERLLAEVEAKRRIVEWHKNWPVLVETQPTVDAVDSSDPSSFAFRASQKIAWMTEREYVARFGSEPPTSPILRLMATVYADHPDYRQEWKP